MLLETFFQDLRTGLRVLIKEKGFCALAVGVLALGICGVTTQFALVNAVTLRGFNFPHADRIMGGGFRDPSQPNNFGGAGLPFAVNQRTQEFGIRMALGADASRIFGMVVRKGVLQLTGGLLLGLGAALLLVQVGGANLQNFLFQVDPTDPTIYGSVAMLLIVVATPACLVPARRATRVDPMTALRTE